MGLLPMVEPVRAESSQDGIAADAAAVDSALRKVGMRLVPLATAIAIVNHMDRSNLSYAALSFNRDNGFNGKVYSIGTAMFYLAFMLCMLPSNLIMMRVGTRSWLAFLLVAWGSVAACFSLISTPAVFYALRVLLGMLEAGAFPACWHFLATFYPRHKITKPFAFMTVGTMAASMIGAPLAAGLLALDGVAGLKGWQWLFLVEGIPSVALGVLVLTALPSSIQSARFLGAEEKEALASEIARDRAPGLMAGKDAAAGGVPTRQLMRMVLGNIRLWGAFLCGALSSVSSNIYATYTPIIIANLLAGKALTNEVSVAAAKGSNGLLPVALAVVPYTLAAAATYLVAASSQRRREQFFHVAAPLVVSGTFLALFPVMTRGSMAGGFVSISVSLAAAAAANGPATALVARLCQGPELVVALPIFSTFAVLGGVAGPLMAGAIINKLGGFSWLTVIMGLMLAATGLLVSALRFYVRATGGFPDEAAAQLAGQQQGAGAEGGGGAAAEGQPPSPSGASGASVCVVLGDEAGLASPKAASAGKP